MPANKTDKPYFSSLESDIPKPVSPMNNVDAARVLENVTYKQCLDACQRDPQDASSLKFAIDIAVKELRRIRPGQTWSH